jgi:cholesterol transport system auxiliary component
LLLPLLTQSIQNTGCFHTVVSPPSASLTDYTLNTQLLVLRQEFPENSHSCIRMTMEATLIDTATARAVAYRRFTTLVPTEENTPYAGVIAANQAAANILRNITNFVCSTK